MSLQMVLLTVVNLTPVEEWRQVLVGILIVLTALVLVAAIAAGILFE